MIHSCSLRYAKDFWKVPILLGMADRYAMIRLVWTKSVYTIRASTLSLYQRSTVTVRTRLILNLIFLLELERV